MEFKWRLSMKKFIRLLFLSFFTVIPSLNAFIVKIDVFKNDEGKKIILLGDFHNYSETLNKEQVEIIQKNLGEQLNPENPDCVLIIESPFDPQQKNYVLPCAIFEHIIKYTYAHQVPHVNAEFRYALSALRGYKERKISPDHFINYNITNQKVINSINQQIKFLEHFKANFIRSETDIGNFVTWIIDTTLNEYKSIIEEITKRLSQKTFFFNLSLQDQKFSIEHAYIICNKLLELKMLASIYSCRNLYTTTIILAGYVHTEELCKLCTSLGYTKQLQLSTITELPRHAVARHNILTDIQEIFSTNGKNGSIFVYSNHGNIANVQPIPTTEIDRAFKL